MFITMTLEKISVLLDKMFQDTAVIQKILNNISTVKKIHH